MSRIQLSRERETLSYLASRLEGRLFLGEDTSNFIDYIENKYQHTLSYKQKRCFEKTKKRDLAIISLFLASGIRISELVNIKLHAKIIKRTLSLLLNLPYPISWNMRRRGTHFYLMMITSL
ncbi:hypothetical protein [Lactococcus formosensis]|uniref:hypothetical protein n=1 Tax=Lactococcus formosensis TaxID=1281486 RepID=UPI0024357E5E|nr:hypothetical protein [Lactococcus formosensis]MDG6119827.1 hypothetical protein [Lactococcus formosensis]